MKNNRLFKILIIASSLLISGCEDKGDSTPVTPEPEDDTSIYIDVEAESFYLNKTYNLKFKYNDSFFKQSAKKFNNDLALLSFGHAFTSNSSNFTSKFLNDIGFEDIEFSGYDVPTSVDTLGFALAKKKINDFTVVGVFTRSLQYGLEWGNNFTIGTEGDHLGFSLRANEVKTSLENYIVSNCENENVKLWISGYSRGGGIANLLASLILRNNTLNVSQDNMFVYTFAAPNSVSVENAVAYENVHNIVNKADLVTNIPPNSYGLTRCGIDYDIYDKNLSNIMHDFDSEIEVSEFVTIQVKEGDDITDDKQLTSTIISDMSEEKQDKTKSAETRELFVENYETAIRNMIVRMFQLSSETIDEMLSALQQLGSSEILKIVYDNSGVRLMNLLKPYFDKDHISYDEDVLQGDCADVIKAAFNILLTPIMLFINEKYSGNLIRVISMHFSDTYYALFLNYIK